MIIRDEKRKRKYSVEESEEGMADASTKLNAHKERKSKKKKSKSHKEIQPTTSDSSPLSKKEKKKKKVSHVESSASEADSDDNEKFVAYRLKKHKKSKKHKKNKKERKLSSVSNSDHNDSIEDKASKIKSATAQNDLCADDDVFETSVTICSKPKMYKQDNFTNSLITLDSDTDDGLQSKNKKSALKVSKDNQNKMSSQNETKVEIIVPQISVAPNIDFEKTAKVTSPNTILPPTNSHDLSSNGASPIIVEANLKKPSKFYVPDILKDDNNDELFIEKELEKHILKKAQIKNTEKSAEENEIKISEPEKFSPKLDINQDLSTDIPAALQEFYDEVSKGFEALVNKPRNRDSKKKSALTVDESLKDFDKLKEIVSKNEVTIGNSSISSQNNMAEFFSLENKVIMVLQPKVQFSFLGKFKLKVLYGAVEVYGTVFSPQNTVKPIEMYSPKGYSSISISTFDLENSYDKENLWDALTSEGVDRSMKTKLHNAITQCNHGWSVLLLENFENTLTNFLNNYCSFKMFPKIENSNSTWCDPKRAEYVLQANFQFFIQENEISIHPQWDDITTNRLISQWKNKKSLCTIVTGGKNVGKSTTIRYLINNFLRHSQKVVLLDLDPGQAELTPPACVSLSILEEPLLGPNFTHVKNPYHQYYLEDVSVVNCITRYIESIKKLVEMIKSNKELKHLPIFVNTMGFCKGIGVDICIFLIKLIEPTNIIQIFSKKHPKNNYTFQLLKHVINEYKTSSIVTDNDAVTMDKICDYELHYIPSMSEGKRQFESWNMEPRQQRELTLLSYLSQIIKNADEKSFCNLVSNSLNNIIPFKLPFSSFYISLIKSNTSPTHILAAMNGNIIALCGIDLDDNTSKADREVLKYPMVVIKPPLCTLYGLGIVRGIDMKRKCVYINTPLTESQLRHVNLLAGCSPVPFSLLHTKSEASNTATPYKADRVKLPTSRETRRGYFRVDQSKKN